MGVEAVYVDTSDTAAVRRALAPGARALLVESPTNPLLKVADIRELGKAARQAGALFVVDNTFLTPLLQRQQETARKVASFLAGHSQVKRVYYPGLASHAGHALQKRQAKGAGAMVSFEIRDAARVPDILAGVKVFLFAESLGGTESLITLPAVQTHAETSIRKSAPGSELPKDCSGSP